MYTYAATVTRVVDGDTFEADVDVGFYHWCKQRFRLMGYNAPEVHGAETSLGLQASAILSSMLLRKVVIIRTHKGDAFGRWLADVEVDRGDVVEALISGGWGVAWNGKGDRPKFDWTKEYPLR